MRFAIIASTALFALAAAEPGLLDNFTGKAKAGGNNAGAASGNTGNTGANAAAGKASSTAAAKATGAAAAGAGTSAAAIPPPPPLPANPTAANAQQSAQVQSAVSAWQSDTGVVSNFLNQGASITDNAKFQPAAAEGHRAEVDELGHKAILEAYLGGVPAVQQAKATLEGGAFQLVVDKLQEMADQGTSAVADIDTINADRCVSVLPNIDAYFKAAADFMGNANQVQQSIRPTACGQNGVNAATNGTAAAAGGNANAGAAGNAGGAKAGGNAGGNKLATAAERRRLRRSRNKARHLKL